MIRRNLNLYLESSVISMYFQDDAPYLRDLTRLFWKEILPYFEVYISEIVLKELKATSKPYLRKAFETLVSEFEVLRLTENTLKLSELYAYHKRLPRADALHLASASMEGMHFLVTWNLRHLYKGGTQDMIREINIQLGISIPIIVTPKDFLEDR